MLHTDLVPGRAYRVLFEEARCAGLRTQFTAVFLGWRADPARPEVRWRDRALFDNGVEIGPRVAGWRAVPSAAPVRLEPDTIC